jgi:hypothetical protein
MTTPNFKDTLFNQFDQLTATFNGIDGKVFWRTGNTLDACVRFLVAAQQAWGPNDSQVQDAKKNFQSLAQGSFQVFRDGYNGDSGKGFTPGDWWDDYGWWGIAALSAYENFDAVFTPPVNPKPDCYAEGDVSKDCCLQFAVDSWTVMTVYAWLKANADNTGPKPTVAGGCWNNYYDEKDPDSGGVENTITNVLYLTLSARLYLATAGQEKWKAQNQEFLNSACASYRWFGEWFINRGILDSRSPMPDQLIYWLLERPVSSGSDFNQKGKPPYTPKQKWSGDQGVFFGGLAGILQMQDAIADNPDIQALSADLQKAGRKYTALEYAAYLLARLAQGSSWLFTYDPFVLHEAVFSSDLINSYSADYATGKGVLMRYISEVKPVLDPTINFQQYIVDSANAIINHPATSENGNGFIWDDKTATDITNANTNEVDFLSEATGAQWDFVVQTARLDALTAAIPFLKE